MIISALVVSGAEISDCYRSRAAFTVTMPQMDDDVTYDIDLFQYPNPADSLLGYDYLVSWRMRGREGASDGFAAYFGGNHYRYTANRLQEYHFEVDSVPFTIGPRGKNGVHRTAQFVNLLPGFISSELEVLRSDSMCVMQTHRDTLVSGTKRRVVDVDLRVNGVLARESEYQFDALSGLPLKIHIENNPGGITEQTMWVEYDTLSFMPCRPLNEELLMEKFPDAFGKYRQSTFRIDNLPGSPLPAFALPTITRERYSRRVSDGFTMPAVVVLLNASDGFTSKMIKDVRAAIAQMPYPAYVIWAFMDNHVDSITDVLGKTDFDEVALMSASALARDCGVSTPPAIIMVDKAGIVRYVSVGYNNDITSDVIQKMTLLSK